MLNEYHGTDEEVRQMQAEALERAWANIAKAEAARDPVRVERKMFGFALADARHKRRLSQSELAARLGVHQPYISRIENGRADPGLKTLLKIAKALDAHLVVEY